MICTYVALFYLTVPQSAFTLHVIHPFAPAPAADLTHRGQRGVQHLAQRHFDM